MRRFELNSNMRCFEIEKINLVACFMGQLNSNMRCFEINMVTVQNHSYTVKQ